MKAYHQKFPLLEENGREGCAQSQERSVLQGGNGPSTGTWRSSVIEQNPWIWQDLAIPSGRDRASSQWDGRVNETYEEEREAGNGFIFLSNCLSLDFSKVDGEWVFGYGNPLQYSWLENPMDCSLPGSSVRGVAKSQTRSSDFTFTFSLPEVQWSRVKEAGKKEKAGQQGPHRQDRHAQRGCSPSAPPPRELCEWGLRMLPQSFCCLLGPRWMRVASRRPTTNVEQLTASPLPSELPWLLRKPSGSRWEELLYWGWKPYLLSTLEGLGSVGQASAHTWPHRSHG